MPRPPSYVAADGDDALIDLFVSPRAATNALVGIHGSALKLKVTAPPVDGKANVAVEKFLGKLLGVPRSRVEVIAGTTGRRKRVRVSSMTAEEVTSVLGDVLSSRAHEPG